MKLDRAADQWRQDANQKIIDLLGRSLPRMHPSALKHEYLTSVANVIAHPVATWKVTSNGDASGRIFHAFVPTPADPVDRHLLSELQAYETKWAHDRDIEHPHDIARLISAYKRDTINQCGLGAYPVPPVTPAEAYDLYVNQGWYRTVPLPGNLQTTQSFAIDPGREPDEPAPAEQNVTRATNANRAKISPTTGQPTRKIKHIGLTIADDNTVRVDDVQFDDEPEL